MQYINVNKHAHWYLSAIADLVSGKIKWGLGKRGGGNREIRPDSRAERGVQFWGLIMI
jgi:hypothetical protein